MKTKSTIVLIGNDVGTHRLITGSLAEQYNFVMITDAARGVPAAFIPNTVLVILELSHAAVFAPLRQHPEWAGVPVLLLASPSEEALKTKLLAAGAQDFLAWPCSTTDLRVRVENLVTIKKSRDRHRDLFESMEDGFCIIEVIFDAREKPVDYRFLEINGTFEKQTGLKNAKGKLMRSLAPHHEQHWFDIYGKIALTGQSARFENRADALHRWYEVYAFRIGPAENRQVAIFFNDILERKRAEEKLKQEHDELITAARAKDDFLAILSHELRTPLNPVLMIASSAAGDYHLPPSVRSDFNIIRKNVEMEARLIDDLLDLTRVTRAKVILDKDFLDVHRVLKDALVQVQEDLKQKHLTLNLKLEAAEPFVFADPVRLQQVFWNLLQNAAKFTPPNGGITVATETNSRHILTIKVTDTGLGLTEDELKRIFRPFSQGDHGAEQGRHRFGGLGLGLTISQKLLELHSGHIQAESGGRNLGATFTIELPVAQRPINEETPPIATAAPVPARAPATAANFHILLVEDHEPTRTVLANLLRRRYHKVATADSLAAARQLLKTNHYDLLISDLGLPDGNGNELMKELRKNSAVKGIALSGFGTEEDLARSHASGFITHLIKPVTIQSLEKALASVN